MKIEIKKMETITTQQKISQFIENQAFSQNENINLSYQSFFRFWKQKRIKQPPYLIYEETPLNIVLGCIFSLISPPPFFILLNYKYLSAYCELLTIFQVKANS
jgi:hypothetical protein